MEHVGRRKDVSRTGVIGQAVRIEGGDLLMGAGRARRRGWPFWVAAAPLAIAGSLRLVVRQVMSSTNNSITLVVVLWVLEPDDAQPSRD